MADGYYFLDPNDNSRVIMLMTFGGFIPPGENNNFGVFADQATTRFRYEIENTGDANPDRRRLMDDIIDITLFFIANQNTLGDGANGNDVPFRDTFPFLALAQQPRPAGTIDDNTRN